jgi:hypothetical protein
MLHCIALHCIALLQPSFNTSLVSLDLIPLVYILPSLRLYQSGWRILGTRNDPPTAKRLLVPTGLVSKKRLAVDQKRLAVDQLFASVLRNNVALVALVTLICSFLPIQDRVRLGQVDKHFYGDEHRGQMVGVYGADCLDIKAALDKVREYMEYETTPYSLSALGLGLPGNWWDESWVAEKFQDSWFDKKSGYDLKAIQEHADFGEAQEEVLKGLAYVNWYRQDDQKDLEKLTADIKKLGPLAPYNSLFDLMKKYNMKYDHFLHAEEPPVYGGLDYAYEIGDSYLQHLKPGRMLSFRDADGKMVKMALKACSRCKKVKDGVWDEYCVRKHCKSVLSVCRDCTTERTCFTCGAEGCVCRFDKCCARGCKNYMCDDSNGGDGPGCSFVLYPGDMGTNDDRGSKLVDSE